MNDDSEEFPHTRGRGGGDDSEEFPKTRGHTRREHRRRADPQSGNSRRTMLFRISFATFALATILAPQLFGGILSWTVWVIAGLAMVSVLAATWALDAGVGEVRMPLGVAVLGTLLWTCVQVMPLPCGLVRSIAPAAVADVELSRSLLGEDEPTMCSISRDPGATAEEVAKGASLLAMFVSAGVLAASGYRRRVFLAVAVSVAFLTFIALAHTVFGLHAVFGIVTPIDTVPHVIAPILNENCLSALLTLGVPVMLALGLSEERSVTKRIAWISAAAITSGCVVLTVSRGGIASLVCTLLIFGALALTRSHGDKRKGEGAGRRRSALLAVAAVIVVGGGLGMFVASKDVLSDYATNDLRKIDLTRQGLLLALESPWTGAGRGGFSAAFVRHGGTFKRAIYPENWPAQWASEWGIPIAVLLAAAIAFAVLRVLRRTHSLMKLAAAAGIVGIAIHDLVDFSLEHLGIAAVAISVLAALVVPRQGTIDTAAGEGQRGIKLRWLTWASCALSMFAVAFVGPRLPGNSVLSLQKELERLYESGDRAAFRAALVRGVTLHPSEPAFALYAGAEASKHNDRSSLRWLTRAMELAPEWASPHVEAARVLAQHGHIDQALLELREAAKYDSSMPVSLACWILEHNPREELALRSAPPGTTRILYLDNVASCLGAGNPALPPIESEIVHLDAAYPGPILRRARHDVAGGRYAEAIATLRPIVNRAPENTGAALILAEALTGAHREQEAIRLLQQTERQVDDPAELVRLRARAEASRGNAAGMRAAIDELRGLAGGSSHLLAAALSLQANLESTLGNDGRAIAAFDESYRFEPNAATLVSLAGTAERLGNRALALRTYTRLVALEPNNSAYQAERDRLQSALNASTRIE